MSQTADPAATAETDPRIAEALARLKAGFLRTTEPRRALLAAMIAHPSPRAIEAIHAALPPGTCDLVTVYRCLDAFEAIGLVRRVFSHSGVGLVYLDSAPEQFQVVDRETGAAMPVRDVPAELYLAIQRVEDLLRAAGYTHVGHVVQFFADKPST